MSDKMSLTNQFTTSHVVKINSSAIKSDTESEGISTFFNTQLLKSVLNESCG